jgi:glycosyltransferase involved in cell wall biosynthesis
MLTIVIPTMNEEKLLPVLLESIKKQTLQPAEVIVADAHSIDSTRAISLKYDALVVDGGSVSLARNRGAHLARTELILFLDADVNLTDPHFLEKAVCEMKERNLEIATCDILPLSDAKVDHILHGAYNKYVRACGALYPHAPGFCLFVKKKLHDKIEGFDESITFCEDHDYARRAKQYGRFGILKSVKIPVSIRRMVRDGRVNIALKYLMAELHLALIGPIRHNRFRYTFGHKEKEQH